MNLPFQFRTSYNTGMPTISTAIASYISTVEMARSQNTVRTYHNGMNIFVIVLNDKGINPETTQIEDLPAIALGWMIAALQSYAPTSERLYLTAVMGFFEYLVAESLSTINLTHLRLLIRQRARRPGLRLPQFPRTAIDEVINYAQSLVSFIQEDPLETLRALRDRAFLLTLADTGLRVHEACNLRRGDIDWFEARAVLIGKGNKQAVVRFSQRSLAALKDYLAARAAIDGASGKALTSLPIFARHDKGTGKRVQRITTTTGRDIVQRRVREALGDAAAGTITPHSFRHYFVTTVLRASGGNLKLAQELARHQNIAITTRYAHLSSDELDQGYWKIFDDVE
jgi:integrase/recombinase XerC